MNGNGNQVISEMSLKFVLGTGTRTREKVKTSNDCVRSESQVLSLARSFSKQNFLYFYDHPKFIQIRFFTRPKLARFLRQQIDVEHCSNIGNLHISQSHRRFDAIKILPPKQIRFKIQKDPNQNFGCPKLTKIQICVTSFGRVEL